MKLSSSFLPSSLTGPSSNLVSKPAFLNHGSSVLDLQQEHSIGSYSHAPTEIFSSVSFHMADATVAPAQDFEPQLNTPALVSFLFIATIFSLLQLRVQAIEAAAVDRTAALEQLRDVKKRELNGAVEEKEVTDALNRYRNAVLKVEQLRTIIPGLARIVQPPSQSLTQDRMDENVQAAKQFLDMDLNEPLEKQDPQQKGLSLGLKIVLALVAMVQIGTLALLSIDPMSKEQTLGAVSW